MAYSKYGVIQWFWDPQRNAYNKMPTSVQHSTDAKKYTNVRTFGDFDINNCTLLEGEV